MSLVKRKFISAIRDWNIKGSVYVAYRLSRLIIPKPKNEQVIKTIHNFKLKIDPVLDNGVERSIYYFGTYEKGTLDIIGKILIKGDVFIDVGANIGLMSIYAGIKVGETGKVFAFEPNPNTRKILEENIVLNKIQNIKVEGVALSNETKKSKIYDRWDVNRGGASLIKPENPSEEYDIEEIPFSDYFNTDQPIKLVKIDVEGYELEVLMGAQKYISKAKVPPALIVEFSSLRTNTFGEGTSPLYEYLKNVNRYRLFKSTAGKERVSKLVEIMNEQDCPKHDNIYCFTDEHLSKLSSILLYKQ